MKSTTLLIIGALTVLGLGGYFLAAQQRNQSDESAMAQPATEEAVLPRDETGTAINGGTEEEAVMGETGTDEADETAKDGEVRAFTLENKGMSYTVKEMRVKKGETVRVTFKVVQGQHDWNLDEFDAHTNVLAVGNQETVEFVASQAGEFEYYCSVPGHRAAGMVGTLIVE
jgi:plastocyanin